MKRTYAFHWPLLTMLAMLNGSFLYLFFLKLPYGIDPMIASLTHIEELSPQVEIAAGLAFAAVIMILFVARQMNEIFKCRFIYLNWNDPHPASKAFFNTRKAPFERKTLLDAYPQIKDSAYAPAMQYKTWYEVYNKHAAEPLVLHTERGWVILRDLMTISFFFLATFLIAWPVNIGLHPNIGLMYLFVFGAQSIFLLLGARSAGFRMIDNVLAADLGMKSGDSMDDDEDDKKSSKQPSTRNRRKRGK